jgi:ParB family transcriptional regulator, chromosome partitioning protein
MKNTGLGKGLDSLIPINDAVNNIEENVPRGTLVRLSLIEPNKQQPRTYMNEDALNALADSIKENGVIEPIVLKRKGTKYEIIAGERRWRAARIAGLKEVPAVIKELSEEKTFEIALIENIQRQDLNPIEEANAYKKLIDDYRITQDSVATKVGRSRASIANSLRLLKLDEKVQKMLIEDILSEGHGKVLASVEDKSMQLKIADEIRDKNLSVRETENLIKKLIKDSANKTEKTPDMNIDAEYKKAEEKLKNIFTNKVVIRHNNKNKGRIMIEFTSADEFDRIMEIIEKKQS